MGASFAGLHSTRGTEADVSGFAFDPLAQTAFDLPFPGRTANRISVPIL